MTQKEVIISCLSYFNVSLPLPFSFQTVFCSHRHTHGHIYNLNACHNLHVASTPFISKPANPSLLHFHDSQLLPPCCQNSRETPRTKCNHPASDLMPLATLALTRWHPSLLSPGICSAQVKFSCTYTWWAPLSLYIAHKTIFQTMMKNNDFQLRSSPCLGSFLLGASESAFWRSE